MKQIKSIIVSCFAIICVALLGSVFTSCSNDDDLLLAGDSQTESVSSLAQDSVKAVTRSMTTSDHELWLSTRNLLTHYCQRKAGHIDTGYPYAEGAITTALSKTVCLPTCYMMAAHALGDLYGYSFALTGTHVGTITSQLGVYYKSLSNLKNKIISGSIDGTNFLTCERLSTTNRSEMKSFIENCLDRNFPVLVAVRADVSGTNAYNKLNNISTYTNLLSPSQTYNPDMQYGTSSDQYILTPSGSTNGHIILLTEVSKWETGNGPVSYLDPLARSRGTGSDYTYPSPYYSYGSYWENRRYVLYSRLLDSMLANSADGYYNAVAIEVKEEIRGYE